jgi:hypothetical protein
MFGPLFSDSAYFSDAKTTFGVFGMICFVVDSQTHTVCCGGRGGVGGGHGELVCVCARMTTE